MKRIISVALMAFLLSSCQEDNPLKTESRKASASFLMNASANVEKRLKFPIANNAYGYGYLECMEGKKSLEIRCPDLFNGIIKFAKENHYPAFKNIQLHHLTEKTTFEKIADDYAEISATTWPHFVSEQAS